MAVEVILTIASVGASMTGSGTFSTLTLRLPCQVSAFISATVWVVGSVCEPPGRGGPADGHGATYSDRVRCAPGGWRAGADGQQTLGIALELEGMNEPELDLTILNFVNFGDPDFVASLWMSCLEPRTPAARKLPVMLTAQNPALAGWTGHLDTNRDAMRAADEEREMPVIDVVVAVEEVDDWEPLLMDQVNPNDDGHQLWTDTVAAV